MELTQDALKYAWSYSRLNQLKTCPKQFFYNVIAKVKSDPEIGRQSKLEIGKAAHLIVELLLKGISWDHAFKKAVKGLTEDELIEIEITKDNMLSFCRRILAFKQKNNSHMRHFQLEENIAVDQQFKSCGYFDKRVFLRSRLDLVMATKNWLFVIDHKFSSSTNWDHIPQLEMYIASLLSSHPHVKNAKAAIHYIPLGKTDWILEIKDLSGLQNTIIQRINDIAVSANSDEPQKGNHCKWCNYRFRCQRDLGSINEFI